MKRLVFSLLLTCTAILIHAENQQLKQTADHMCRVKEYIYSGEYEEAVNELSKIKSTKNLDFSCFKCKDDVRKIQSHYEKVLSEGIDISNDSLDYRYSKFCNAFLGELKSHPNIPNPDTINHFIEYIEHASYKSPALDALRIQLSRIIYWDIVLQSSLLVANHMENCIPYFETMLNLQRPLKHVIINDYTWLLDCIKEAYSYLSDFRRHYKMDSYLLEKADCMKYKYGKKSNEYLDALLNIANNYKASYRDEQADEVLNNALNLAKKMSPEIQADVLKACAQLYLSSGNAPKAEKAYTDALNILEKRHGKTYYDLTNLYTGLGATYISLGDLKIALKHFQSALDMLETYLYDTAYTQYCPFEALETCIDVKETMSNIYLQNQDYLNAIKHCEDIILLCDSADYFSSMISSEEADGIKQKNLFRIGLIYKKMGDREKGEQHINTCLEIALNDLKYHPNSYINLYNIALCYAYIDNSIEEEKYLSKALDNCKNRVSSDPLSYANILGALGDCYLGQNKYDLAIEHYEQAAEVYKSLAGKNDNNYLTQVLVINHCNQLLGNYANAEDGYRHIFSIFKERYIQATHFCSEKQLSDYWSGMQAQHETWIPFFAYHYHFQKPSISQFAYDNELFCKGLLLQSSENVKHSVLESKNKQLLQQWKKLEELKRIMINVPNIDSQIDFLEECSSKAEQLEKEITRSSATYRENQRQWNITWDSVRAELQPNQVAIEYMSAPLNKDSTMYCALLLRDTCSYPILIPLFEAKQATVLISDDEGETYSYDENGASLSSLIWSKVLPYIKPGESVYFAPTGLLLQLAIEALPYDTNRTMGDVFDMVRVSSTRELVLNRSSETHKSATLYGGIQYDMDATDMEAASRQYQGEQLLASRSFGAESVNRGHANYLPGTKAETEQIIQLLAENHIKARLYTDNDANEESFKALSGKHQNVLHLATHGFYWTDSTAHRQKYFSQHRSASGVKMFSDDNSAAPHTIDPLNRCGLLFAGANIALQGYSNELPEGVQDGILTAKEISLLDLRDANLVVLSACETGKGEITGDGVFGLQRAFKMAGAQTIIMSLWPVNDDATQLLMTEFYKNWITLHQPKREAFRNAQNTVRARYKEPTYWAGFIMLD